MISIVTGTLNRKHLLPDLIQNTVDSNSNLELVLVDGGSTDGTIEFIEQLRHPRIKMIKVGKRSSYPHFMNLGIKNSSFDLVCQWNDDVLLVNDWNEVIGELEEGFDFYLFNWKYGTKSDTNQPEWLSGNDQSVGWCLCDLYSSGGEIVMNYGIYKKSIFKKIGMYNPQYRYYYADSDMSYRAKAFGFKNKSLRHIKVCSLDTPKKAIHYYGDSEIYKANLELYKNNKLPTSLEKLK